MYKFKYGLLLFLLAPLLHSCEKVIDIDLTEGERRYVVEGTVSNRPGEPAEVRLSETKDFEDDNTFIGISGAVVSIRVNNSASYILNETSTGIYTSTAFSGTPGSVYELSVSINGKTFTATSTMPSQIVRLDTITVSNFAFGGSTTLTVSPDYLDPVGPGNSYRFIQYVNGALVKRVFVANDNLNDGLRSTRPLINPDSDIEQGNIVRVDMLCIDPEVYTYWYSLDQAATGNGNATPANPVTNISGGCLGYFSAHSITTKTIVVP
jgi:hypothetical protein